MRNDERVRLCAARGWITKIKKFHPAATPKLSSTNLPAKRINGEVIGRYVTISDIELLTQRITAHLVREVRDHALLQHSLSNIPERESDKQTRRTPLHQRPSDLHV
jgi:hypothetical protein